MPARKQPIDVAEQVKALLEERQRHLDAINAIDAALARIGEILRSAAPAAGRQVAAAVAKTQAAVRKRKTGYPLTAEKMILAFVSSKGRATTHDIRDHWRSQGRPGVPDYVISRLVKIGKLQAERLGGRRGSIFTARGKVAPRSSATRAAPKAKPAARTTEPREGTASDFILNFIRERGNPTTTEISEAWQKAGRSGRAGKILNKLIGRGKLKREPLPKGEGRGSRYMLA